MPPSRWHIRLSAPAERDFADIIRWTLETFGPRQAIAYRATLTAALAALADGPQVVGSVPRDEIIPGLRTLHVARRGRRGRHFILYRAAAGDRIEVIRILHDSMDLTRHIGAPGEP